jgi:hypothetical protein
VDREYGAGRGWIDILIRKPLADADGQPVVQKEVIELKVRRARDADPVDEGLAQLDRYLKAHHLDHGYLVIFDRRPVEIRGDRPAELSDTVTPAGRKVVLLRA